MPDTDARTDATEITESVPGADAGSSMVAGPGPQDTGSSQIPVTGPGAPLLVTGPDPRSYIFRYTLACIPILLVIISIFIRTFIEGMTRSLMPGIPSMFSSATPAISSIAGITTYLVAPIGVFVIVAAIGWALRRAELWTGPALALGLAIAGGLVLAGTSGTAMISEKYLVLLLHWIAFLIQPFSFLAVAIVVIWTEKMRRSISYRIEPDMIVIRGGVWKQQEHIVPHHQIVRIVLEQDVFGRKFNYGTIIPQSISGWGTEMSIRGIGASGQKDGLGAMLGYAKGREEASRNPMDCFYGIPDPEKARQILTGLVLRSAYRQEEQVEYLKQICAKLP